MKYEIYLDTNFLLMPCQFGIDVISEIGKICDFPYEIIVIKPVLDELKKIAENKETAGRDKRAAKLGIAMVDALKIPKALKIASAPHGKNVDDMLFYLAKNNNNVIIATADINLKKRLKSLKDHKIIILRQKKYLKIEGGENVL